MHVRSAQRPQRIRTATAAQRSLQAARKDDAVPSSTLGSFLLSRSPVYSSWRQVVSREEAELSGDAAVHQFPFNSSAQSTAARNRLRGAHERPSSGLAKLISAVSVAPPPNDAQASGGSVAGVRMKLSAATGDGPAGETPPPAWLVLLDTDVLPLADMLIDDVSAEPASRAFPDAHRNADASRDTTMVVWVSPALSRHWVARLVDPNPAHADRQPTAGQLPESSLALPPRVEGRDGVSSILRRHHGDDLRGWLRAARSSAVTALETMREGDATTSVRAKALATAAAFLVRAQRLLRQEFVARLARKDRVESPFSDDGCCRRTKLSDLIIHLNVATVGAAMDAVEALALFARHRLPASPFIPSNPVHFVTGENSSHSSLAFSSDRFQLVGDNVVGWPNTLWHEQCNISALRRLLPAAMTTTTPLPSVAAAIAADARHADRGDPVALYDTVIRRATTDYRLRRRWTTAAVAVEHFSVPPRPLSLLDVAQTRETLQAAMEAYADLVTAKAHAAMAQLAGFADAVLSAVRVAVFEDEHEPPSSLRPSAAVGTNVTALCPRYKHRLLHEGECAWAERTLVSATRRSSPLIAIGGAAASPLPPDADHVLLLDTVHWMCGTLHATIASSVSNVDATDAVQSSKLAATTIAQHTLPYNHAQSRCDDEQLAHAPQRYDGVSQRSMSSFVPPASQRVSTATFLAVTLSRSRNTVEVQA